VLAAVSTQNKLLLGGMAAIFIVFALISSFVLPSRNPSFPGKNRNTFLLITGVLFVGMLFAVEFFAIEEEEPGEEQAALLNSRS
jgi:hypothetical protein